MGLEEVDRLIAEAEKTWERQMVENVSATIKETVQEHLSDWMQRFGAELPVYAAESLELRTIELVNRCVALALKNPEAFQAVGVGRIIARG